MTPRIPSLVDFVAQFLRPEFNVDEATRVLGVVTEEDDLMMIVAPYRDTDVAEIQYEKLETPDGKTILGGIVITFNTPITVDFAELTARYGPEQELPRLKPRNPIPYSFQPESKHFQGVLILEVPERTTARHRSVLTIALRRFPPEMT